jgi:UDPglucose--hexose-1-phosphate uridylyltransferase
MRELTMNEMRRDPITRKWVIIDRTIQPEEVIQKLKAAVLASHAQKKIDTACPFCPGKEDKTPPSIMEGTAGSHNRNSHSAEWTIRVIPNNDPVFRIEGNLNRRLVSTYDVMDALGAHEMIIEHRNHVDWDEMAASEISDILNVYQERMNDLSRDERFGHLFIFKNYGPNSNANLQHPHSTLIASPSVPERIRRELDFTRRHFKMKERCLFCDIVSEELRRSNQHESGVITNYANFVTISPFFASHPFETWILPRKHNSNFRNLKPELFPELAVALQENLKSVKNIVGPLSYTLLLFTRPNKIWGGDRDYWTTIDDDYHWHFKFFPRFPNVPEFHRNFSAGTGYMLNQIAPEHAAELLRNQVPRPYEGGG